MRGVSLKRPLPNLLTMPPADATSCLPADVLCIVFSFAADVDPIESDGRTGRMIKPGFWAIILVCRRWHRVLMDCREIWAISFGDCPSLRHEAIKRAKDSQALHYSIPLCCGPRTQRTPYDPLLFGLDDHHLISYRLTSLRIECVGRCRKWKKYMLSSCLSTPWDVH